MVYFEALEDFWSDERQSQYCSGFRYTARTKELQNLIPEWVEQGRVKIVEAPVASAQGEG